jgi:c-di-GMP-binding flagellar brake protein YcgR
VKTLLAGADSISVAVKTIAGRTIEYRTSFIREEEGRFSLTMPPDLGERLEPGQVVLVKASLVHRYALFEAQVLEVVGDPPTRIDLATPAEGAIRSTARRQDFRVSASLPAILRIDRPFRPGRPEPEPEALTGTTYDISAGGVGMLVNLKLDSVVPAHRSRGRLELTLVPLDQREGTAAGSASGPLIRCGVTVVRIEQVGRTSTFRFGLAFGGVSESQRAEISRFVIERQLALRRRGVLL